MVTQFLAPQGQQQFLGGLPSTTGSSGFGSSSSGNNLASSIFAEDPNLAFLTHLRRLGIPQSQQDFLNSHFSTIFDRFRQGQGSQLAQGQVPTNSFFGNFLPQFDTRQFQRQFSPSARGLGTTDFIGRGTRFVR